MTEQEQTAFILKSVALALNLKTYELAEKLEINRQQMYDYTMGKKVPRYGIWSKIKITFPNVSSDFLLTGKGLVLTE